MRSEIYAINGRISFVGFDKDEIDETIKLVRGSIRYEANELYGKDPQVINDSANNLVVFRIRGEEIGRVQHNLVGIRYHLRHPGIGVDDFLAESKRFVERDRRFLERISA